MAASLDKDNENAAARYHLMIEIAITFAVSLFGLFLLFAFMVTGGGARGKDCAVKQRHPPVAGLSFVSVPHLGILFGEEDYRKLRTRPELKEVSKRFRRDRGRIVLMWLGELQRDLHILWEFRRFLVRNGLPVTFREEAGVVSAALAALLYLKIVRVTIFIFGPFALLGALKAARFLVETLSSRSAALRAHVPDLRKTEIEQRWSQHLQALGMTNR
jgi:hypothetical protein